MSPVSSIGLTWGTPAPSRSITTELPPGATLLENGHIQVVGYAVHAEADRLQAGGGPFHLHLVPAELLTEEEVEAAALEEIELAWDDPRVVAYSISPTVSIVVSTLGEGEEQAITLEQFLRIWSASPPEDSEHLAYALWRTEYGENAMVVSITEEVP